MPPPRLILSFRLLALLLVALPGNPVAAKNPGRISAGDGTSFFVTDDGRLYGFGRNDNGQLGDGSTTSRSSPVLIEEGVDRVAATFGPVTFHLRRDGTLWGTGRNDGAILGPASVGYITRATLIARNVRDFAATPRTLFYLTTDDTLWGLGANEAGQLGTGDRTPATAPVRIATAVAGVAAGPTRMFYWTRSGQLLACGSNTFGVLGDGSRADRLSPVTLDHRAGSISVGANVTWSLSADGTAHSWGYWRPAAGGDDQHLTTPQPYAAGYRAVEATGETVLALRANGDLWRLQPHWRWAGEKITDGVVEFSAGTDHFILVDDEDRIWTGGENTHGQLGRGNTTAVTNAQLVSVDFIRPVPNSAPAEFAGRSLLVVVEDGYGLFASSGSYRLAAASSGNGYTVTPVSGFSAPSTGTYTYRRLTGTTASLEIRDSVTGAASASQLSFTTPTEARFSIAGPGGGQSGRAYFETVPYLRTQPRSRLVATGHPSIVTTAVGSGAPTLRYQWYVNGALNANLTSSGVVSSGFTTAGEVRRLRVEVSNSYGMVRSAEATLTLVTRAGTTATALAPQRLSAAAGSRVVLRPPFSSVSTTAFQWRRHGRPLPGATASELVLESLTSADAGRYELTLHDGFVGVAAQVDVTLIAPPQITVPPAARTILEGTALRLEVSATSATPITYQWFRNGTILSGATAAVYTLATATAAAAGDYTVRLANTDGSVTSAPARVEIATAPRITAPPQSRALAEGTSTTLTVTATGTPPLAYQWRRNGADLPGATEAQWTLTGFDAAQAGRYSVVVSSLWGRATSPEASLELGRPPVITRAPVGVTAAPPVFANGAGAFAGVTFSVAVEGTGPFTYQWYREGRPAAGVTTAIYTMPAVSAIYVGNYWVEITNALGSVRSAPVKLNLGAPASLPVIVEQPRGTNATALSPVTLTVRATGGSALRYVWRRNGTDITGSNAPTLAVLAPGPGGTDLYSVLVLDATGNAVTSDLAAVTAAPASALVNLSVRTRLDESQTLILGAVVGGAPKAILARAAGPALRAFGLEGLADPRLELYGGGELPRAVNDDWPAALASVAAGVGAFPFSAGSRDAGLVETLGGAFTLQVRGAGAGVVLVETYDAGGGTLSRLVNVSARHWVGTGDGVLIAGIALGGSGTRQVLIRGVGPRLAAFGVANPLRDPRLEVFDSAGRSLAVNDNWNAALAPVFAQVGAFPLTTGGADAALLITLNAGRTYTVQLAGADGGSGEGLIELYEVP